MRIDVITIFPEVIQAGTGFSIVKRAQEKGVIDLRAHDLRDYTHNRHRSTDDEPYGPGAGMVMKPEPLFEAVEAIISSSEQESIDEEGLLVPPHERKPKVLLMTPQGEPFSQRMAREFAAESHLIIMCGHYEGVDERVREHLVDKEVSIGDYVLTGGELPALVVLDAVIRLLPGVLGDEESAVEESFTEGLLEYPHYTRPAKFRGWQVPDVLLSGHHAEIAKWRRQKAIERTLDRRPDLLEHTQLTEQDKKVLLQILEERAATQNSDIKTKNSLEEDDNAGD
jgi:tRNA (guanine37-N1)-methyltransferase